MTRGKPRRGGVVLCIAGLGVVASAAIPARQIVDGSQGARAPGLVTGLRPNVAEKSDGGVFPSVQFTESDGTIVRFTDKVGANPSPYKVGDPVTVIYKPGAPPRAAIDRGLRAWTPVILRLLLGSILGALGLWRLRGGASVGADRALGLG